MISVVIPVFNERESLEPLFREILSALASRPFEILFVDDRARNLDAVRAAIGPVETMQPGVDFTDFQEVLRRAVPASSD